ncbi:MAG: hypothetical protein M1818_002250 [Claussenomyces sp. TS43310]|nr:MAG: hypothetical protein M1818_002250 [Claussenomyces sp. TS43310]
MAGNDYQVPDLDSVLRTLAALGPQDQHHGQLPAGQSWTTHGHANLGPMNPNQIQAYAPTERHPAPRAMNTMPQPVDPTAIIDWSAGLRCVMKTIAVHENVVGDIRRMIKMQHQHEEQWWNGRQALIVKQEARVDGQRKLDEVLRAVGGATFPSNTLTGPEAAAEELKTFDMKVYKAQLQMVKEMSLKLKSLGVPFFGTRVDLVRAKGKDEPRGYDGTGEVKKKVDEEHLVELQRRMLTILEELSQG